MKKIIEAHPQFTHLLDIWRRAQAPMYKVRRWGNHHKKYPRLRRQSTLEHSHSINILVDIILMKLSLFRRIDGELVRQAFLFHDFGEGILERDVLLHEKSDEKDFAEFQAFERIFRPLGEVPWEQLERAYLLQFAERNPECFWPHHRRVMAELWKTRRVECLLFFGIEVLDYILYPLSHKDTEIAPDFFVHIIGGNAQKLDRLVKELPEFGTLIWTPAVSEAARNFVTKPSQAKRRKKT